MAKIVRTEVRQRGIIGKIFKWSFIGFNLLMVFVMLKACSATSDVMSNAHSDAEQAGSAIGADPTRNYVPGGWPNGRRIGEDVIDIGVTAVISDLRSVPLTIRSADGIDNVGSNDAIFNQVFPYAATPHNGRNFEHNPRAGASPLLNFSTRGTIGTGENILIGGLVIRGNAPVRVLVRGTGPSLSAFGVVGPVNDTIVQIWQGSTMLAENDDWKTTQQTDITNTGYAPLNDREGAILMTLPPGSYTTTIRGKNNATGVGLVEGFLID